MQADHTTADLIGAFATLPTCLISDSLGRLRGAVGLRSFGGTPRLCGPAFTVKTRPGDNLFVHLALDLARPGDILVIDGGAQETGALMGEIMLRHAVTRGIGGFVMDAAIRDVDAFATTPLPCFARGVSHQGAYRNGPGLLRGDIAVGGMVVHHGDIVVADEDGIIAVTPQEAGAVLEAARAAERKETELLDDITRGRLDRSWLGGLLAQHR